MDFKDDDFLEMSKFNGENELVSLELLEVRACQAAGAPPPRMTRPASRAAHTARKVFTRARSIPGACSARAPPADHALTLMRIKTPPPAQDTFDRNIEEMMEGTGYDRPSILGALCVLALQQGGAQQAAVRRVLDRQGWFQPSHSTSPRESGGWGGVGGRLLQSGGGEGAEEGQRPSALEEKLAKAESYLEAVERAEALHHVRAPPLAAASGDLMSLVYCSYPSCAF